MIDALVLAGSSNKGELVSYCGATKDALIKLGDKPMVLYVLKALLDNPEIDRICLVGVQEYELLPYVRSNKLIYCPAGQDPLDSFAYGCACLSSDKGNILVLTADIPLITAEAIDDFLSKCGDNRYDIYYPIVDKSVVEHKYPGVERTYVRLKDGTFTGGNLFLVRTRSIEAILAHGRQLINYRKRPLLMARYLGVGIVLRYLLGQLSIEDIVERVAELAATSSKAVISGYPEIGFDVDKLSDYRLVTQALNSQKIS